LGSEAQVDFHPLLEEEAEPRKAGTRQSSRGEGSEDPRRSCRPPGGARDPGSRERAGRGGPSAPVPIVSTPIALTAPRHGVKRSDCTNPQPRLREG
jgi:hypothetical protein